jgi:hypothetical protein
VCSGLKIVAENVENNGVNVNSLDAMRQFDCIQIAIAKQMGSILII